MQFLPNFKWNLCADLLSTEAKQGQTSNYFFIAPQTSSLFIISRQQSLFFQRAVILGLPATHSYFNLSQLIIRSSLWINCEKFYRSTFRLFLLSNTTGQTLDFLSEMLKMKIKFLKFRSWNQQMFESFLVNEQLMNNHNSVWVKH